MIATCAKCGKLWETSEEDACTPGTLCPGCYGNLDYATFWDEDPDDGATPQSVADEDFRRQHPHDGDTEE